MFLKSILIACVALPTAILTPPSLLIKNVNGLVEIAQFSSLPPAIVAGNFTVDGTSAKGWKMAEPGGAFNATDTPVGDAPGRRLVFAGCNASLCVLHYERGGIAHFYELLALSKTSSGWTAIWNARGKKPLPNYAALSTIVHYPSDFPDWNQQDVKGDF